MLEVRELKGWSHVFQLTDGSAFRILPHEVKPVDEKLVSDDLKRGESMRLVSLSSPVSNAAPTVENYSEKAEKKSKKSN